MKRIYVYGLTEDIDGDFVEWFEEEFHISFLENWTCLSEETSYMDMDWRLVDCENIAKHIKEAFPELTVEIFEFVMNNTPIIKL